MTWTRGRIALFAVAALGVAVYCGRDVPRSFEARLSDLLREGPDLEPGEVRQALASELRTAPLPSGKGGATPFPTRSTLSEFYAKRSNRLAWSDENGKLLPHARTLLDTLRRAGEHGLRPEDYALRSVEGLEAKIEKDRSDTTATTLADLDVLLSAAFFRYASDLSSGRLRPDEVQKDWHAKPPEIDLVAALDGALAKDGLEKMLEDLPPPHPGYARLRESLARLREIDAKGGWPQVPGGPKLEPGASGPRVTALRERLGLAAGDAFDESVASAVRGFQAVHGIEPDGKVGEKTLVEMNVPVRSRIRQVELNLERWRWIPRNLGDPAIVVNIPGFELELVRDRAPALRSRIVVGKAFNATPVFSDRIVGVLANPPWNVPPSIAVNEYLPELRKNPHALERQGLKILQGSGDDAREIDPGRVDWGDLGEENFPYRIRQDPGPENALGKLKFELTNAYHIYLHDTPADHLFARSARALSHGCIRVEKPVELAEAILDGASRDQLQEALAQPEEQRIPVKPAVRVHILYWTAWAGEDGVLHFAPDLYDFDRVQLAALDRREPLPAAG